MADCDFYSVLMQVDVKLVALSALYLVRRAQSVCSSVLPAVPG